MERRDNLMIREKPQLRRPALVCGISGWVDGGQAATGSAEYLVEKLGAREFAEIPLERFHVYQVPGQTASRPHIKIEDGLLSEHRFPSNRFLYWVNPHAEQDLVVFLGTEPNLYWQEYAEAIFGLVGECGVSRIYLLGGVLDKTPHTREPNVSCACTSAELKQEMLRYGIRFTSYEGPGRFGTTLLYMCQQRGIEMVSFTTRATYYPEFSIVIPRNPKAIRALVKRLNGVLRLAPDMSDLDAEVDEFERKLGAMASRSGEFRSYLEKLESDYVETLYQEPLELSGDEAVEIAEDLLRRKPEE